MTVWRWTVSGLLMLILLAVWEAAARYLGLSALVLQYLAVTKAGATWILFTIVSLHSLQLALAIL